MEADSFIDSDLFDAATDQGILFDGVFFEKLSMKSTATTTVAVCKKCSSSVEIKGYKHCTSNFLNHLKRKHGNDCVEEYKLCCKQRKIEAAQSASASTNKCVRKSKLNPYTQESFDEDIVKFVSHSMVSLNCIEDPYLSTIFEKLNIQKIGLTVIRTLGRRLKKYYDKQVVEIKELLKKVNNVCTTVDIWSGRKRSFLGVTAHWIDLITLKRKSRALACRRFSGVHNFQRITELLQQIHQHFGLDSNKIVATITDNGSNFVKAFTTFGIHPKSIETNKEESSESSEDIEINALAIESEDVTEFQICQARLPSHLRCCSHTLNLIATVDLEHVLTTNPELSNVHKSVMEKCNSLWKKGNQPKSAEIIQNILGHSLSRSGPTRWNSVYDALKQISTIKEKSNALHKALGHKNPLRDYEFDYLKEYLSCLKPIAEALDILQGENNTYYGLLLPTILMLKKKLNRMLEKGQEKVFQYCKPIAENLLKHVERRFENFFTLSSPDAERAIIAALSYPRFKNKWFTCIQSEDQSRLKNLFITILLKEFNSSVDDELSMVVKNIKEDEFFDFDDTDVDNNPSLGQPWTKAEHSASIYFSDEFRSLEMLNKYSRIKNIFLKFNIPLPSSAPVERLFSFATMTNSPKANRLSDEHFEQRVVIKANLNYAHCEKSC